MGKDIEWMLDEEAEICVVKAMHCYLVEELITNGRTCVISFTKPKKNGLSRMLFDGDNIETESYMGFIGMLDVVNESPNKRVIIRGDATVEEL